MRKSANRNPLSPQSVRGQLMARRRELLSHLGEVRLEAQSERGPMAEEDQAQLSHEEFISVSRNQMNYQALREVDRALERLEAGEFGVCESCGEPIGEKRLRAIPWACFCVRCQEQLQVAHQSEPAPLAATLPYR